MLTNRILNLLTHNKIGIHRGGLAKRFTPTEEMAVAVCLWFDSEEPTEEEIRMLRELVECRLRNCETNHLGMGMGIQTITFNKSQHAWQYRYHYWDDNEWSGLYKNLADIPEIGQVKVMMEN